MSELYAADGSKITQQKVVLLPPEYLKMLAVFADTSEDMHLRLVCSLCKEDIGGRNHKGDLRWKMGCTCRSFVGGNPLPMAH